MGQKSYMDYDRVQRLADEVTQAAEELKGGRTAVAQAPSVGVAVPIPPGRGTGVPVGTAFGNTANASACQSAYAAAQGAGDAAAESLGGTLTTDAQRLEEVISVFRRTDAEAADRLLAAARSGVNIYSAHVHSSGSNNNDLVRAGQINELRSEIEGPAIIGADLNAELDDGNRSAKAVGAFENRGFDVDAGEVGGTSPSGRSIDYVMTGPGLTTRGQPELVDGGPSDHDGQAVDIAVPRW